MTPEGKRAIAESNRRRAGKYSTACADGCTCSRHDHAVIRARADKQTGTHDSAATRERKRVAAVAAHARAKAEFGDLSSQAYEVVVPPPPVESVEGLEAHRAMAARLGIRIIAERTLRRYGLTELDWLEMLAAQGWACAVCRRRVMTFNTDHEHVPGWKTRPPEERKRYVRGILCTYDNYRVVHSTMNAETARKIAAYTYAYEARRDA